MASTFFERRSIRVALETYLQSVGWGDLTYDEGFMSEKTITVPLVTVEIVQPRKASLQMGSQKSDLYKRNIQIDCYMETEARAMKVTDDIMDFIELTPLSIIDNTSATLGSIICYDNETIYADVLPPVLTDPKLLRWRGLVKSQWEAHYTA